LFGVMRNRLLDPRFRGFTLKSRAFRARSVPIGTMRTGRVRNRPRSWVTGIFGEIAAAVRRGDEDDAAHIWHWLDEHGPAQQIAPFWREVDFVERFVGDGVLHPIVDVGDQEGHPGYGR